MPHADSPEFIAYAEALGCGGLLTGGTAQVTAEEITAAGGLSAAITLKAAQILRETVSALEIPPQETDKLAQLKYLTPHRAPHLDEYLAMLMFRACLPEEYRNLETRETTLFSLRDDAEAKALWARSAVFGIGGTANGGATALLGFDEHVPDGESRDSDSLTMLLKRRMFGSQAVPPALYTLLNEVDCIDSSGGAHPKNLASYIKNLQNTPITSDGAYMDPTWKTAVCDGALSALLMALRDDVPLSDRRVWLPAVRATLDNYRNRSPLKSDPLFADAYSKVRNLFLTTFDKEISKGATLLTYADEQGRRVPRKSKSGRTTAQIMLMPYIAAAVQRYWGAELGELILAPFWHTRIAREMAHTRVSRALTRDAKPTGAGYEELQTEVGRVTLIRCLPAEIPIADGVSMTGESWIIDFDADETVAAPGAINRYLQTNNNGLGYTIFRDAHSGTIVLSKGSSTPESEWVAVVNALLEDEGSSDAQDLAPSATGEPAEIGCWHVTRNANGYAAFLLNGNPAHRYVPKSAICADMLADIVEWAQTINN
ncbi:MAG: hypothetical protein LBN30_03110 [Oscillospiraceae bacterium]|jgi:hypothetical protein|nr:hypothetical protein [Oscillospiraceae bacterium]